MNKQHCFKSEVQGEKQRKGSGSKPGRVKNKRYPVPQTHKGTPKGTRQEKQERLGLKTRLKVRPNP